MNCVRSAISSRVTWVVGIAFLCGITYAVSASQILQSTEMSPSATGNVYLVTLQSQADAATLDLGRLDPLLRIGNSYLTYGDKRAARWLQQAGLTVDLVVADIDRDCLAIDRRRDDRNLGIHELLYEQQDVRLFRVGNNVVMAEEVAGNIIRIGHRHPKIVRDVMLLFSLFL